jgi:hypothetical protein
MVRTMLRVKRKEIIRKLLRITFEVTTGGNRIVRLGSQASARKMGVDDFGVGGLAEARAFRAWQPMFFVFFATRSKPPSPTFPDVRGALLACRSPGPSRPLQVCNPANERRKHKTSHNRRV